MPVPLELLYQLRPIDSTTDLWGQRFFNSLQLTLQAGATHLHQSTTPADDKVWFITGIWGWAAPAAGSVLAFHPILLNAARPIAGAPGPGVEVFDLGREYPSPVIVGGTRQFYRQVDWVIAGGQQHLVLDVVFSAGNVAHVSRWGFQAYEVARGNVVLR